MNPFLKKKVLSSFPIIVMIIVIMTGAGCNRPLNEPKDYELHVGYMICNSLSETKARFSPLSSYLSDFLGVEVVPHYINTHQFEKQVQQGKFQVAHTNSLLYVIFNKNHGWKLLAGEKQGSHGSYTAGVIFVRHESEIKSLEDLKGKRMMFGPELAPMGFLSQYYLLMEKGIDPEMDLAYYAFPKGSFTHEKVVYSVLYEGYDAGSVPLLDLENMEKEGKIAESDYRVLAAGELIPYCTFSTAPELPENIRRKLEEALTGLTKDVTAGVGNEVLNVLERAGIDGFEILEDSNYDPVRRMARKVNMPPYQKYW